VVAVVGAILTPVVAVLAAILAAVVAGLFVPLLPVLVIAAFVWVVVKMSRPSHRSVPS
jgi:fucose permease